MMRWNELSTIKKLIFLKRVKGGGGGGGSVIKTVTGTLLHILDALAKPAVSFEVGIEPQQDLHGQESPYPSGGGKNKLNADSFIRNKVFEKNGSSYVFTHFGSGIANRATEEAPVSLKSGQTVTFSFDYTGTNSNSFNARFGDNGTYSDSTQVPLSNGKGTVTVTLTNDASAFQLYFGAGSTGVGEALTMSNIQLEIGSTATDFAPFENICPITGWTGVDVYRSGADTSNPTTIPINLSSANLADVTFIDGKYYSDNGELIESIRTKYEEEYLPVFPVINYEFNYTASSTYRIRVHEYDSSKTWLRQKISQSSVEGSNSIAYTPSSDAVYIRLSLPVDATDMRVLSTVYGGTLTNNGTGEWVLSVDRIKVAFNGSESWVAPSGATNQYGAIYYTSLSVSRIDNKEQNIICDTFPPSGNTSASSPTATITGYSGGGQASRMYFFVRFDFAEDSEAWNTWLTENNIAVVYKVTPVTYTLTEQQAMTLLKGENNIWTDGNGTLSLTYKAQA